MNNLIKILSKWQRECKTGMVQPNFFKGGISSVKMKESMGKLNCNGGYFCLDGAFSLDVVEERLFKWVNDKYVGNVCIYYSDGQCVGIHEETTVKL